MSTLERFHPAVQSWFQARLGEPTAPQAEGWPLIRDGRNVLIAAPTGSGKTLAGFLSAIDSAVPAGAPASPRRPRSYTSRRSAPCPTTSRRTCRGRWRRSARWTVAAGAARARPHGRHAGVGARRDGERPPHILVTTPESLYLLLTSDSGRAMLSTTRTVIVDEIHALVRDKRGAHLALSLERLERWPPAANGWASPRQKPLEEVGSFLVGAGRECALVDAGTFRTLDLAVEVPPSALSTVCSHEQWAEIYERLAELVRAHRTTLVFVNTRKMAERISAQLSKLLGEDAVTSHHGSLSASGGSTPTAAQGWLPEGLLPRLAGSWARHRDMIS